MTEVEDMKSRLAELAVERSNRLATVAGWCTNFMWVVGVLGYLGAIGVLAQDPGDNLQVALIIAASITGPLLLVTLFCAWAKAYATDLAWRAY